jgi:hypothetical protein
LYRPLTETLHSAVGIANNGDLAGKALRDELSQVSERLKIFSP